MISGVIKGDKCRGLDDGILEGLHGSFMRCLPREGDIFASEVDKQACDGRIIFDPNA